MTNPPLWLKALIVVLTLAAIVVLYVRCATFKRIVAECGPALATRAAEILTRDEWKEEMKAIAAVVGLSTLECAVRVLLDSLSQPETPEAHGLAAVVGQPGDLRHAIVHKRASLWLAEVGGAAP